MLLGLSSCLFGCSEVSGSPSSSPSADSLSSSTEEIPSSPAEASSSFEESSSPEASSTEERPLILIHNADELHDVYVEGASSVDYRLEADIDCPEFDDVPFGELHGILDGNGHTIRNLNVPLVYRNYGLVQDLTIEGGTYMVGELDPVSWNRGYAVMNNYAGAEVMNVTVKGVTMYFASDRFAKGKDNVFRHNCGFLVGRNEGFVMGCTATDCTMDIQNNPRLTNTMISHGAAEGTNEDTYISYLGGIVGLAEQGSWIKDCVSSDNRFEVTYGADAYCQVHWNGHDHLKQHILICLAGGVGYVNTIREGPVSLDNLVCEDNAFDVEELAKRELGGADFFINNRESDIANTFVTYSFAQDEVANYATGY